MGRGGPGGGGGGSIERERWTFCGMGRLPCPVAMDRLQSMLLHPRKEGRTLFIQGREGEWPTLCGK